MLRVLSHYLPVRKALLVLSETTILWVVLATAGTAHLWHPSQELAHALARGMRSMTPETARGHCLLTAFLVAALAQVAISFNELYDFRVSLSRYERARRFVGSAGSALAVTLVVVVLADWWQVGPALDFPGLSLWQKVRMLIFALLIGFALLYSWRTLFHGLLRRARFFQRVLSLGSSRAAHVLAREMRTHAASGYEVAGILPELLGAAEREELPAFDPAETGTADLVLQDAHLDEAEVLRAGDPPRRQELLQLARELRVDEIVATLADRRKKLPVGPLLRCRLAGISVRSYDPVFENVAGKISVEALRPSYLIFDEGFSRHPWGDLLKRVADLCLALVMLLVLWPVMLITAIAVRMNSEGPALFQQERVGRDGRPFTLLKFRSMYIDAEKRTGPVWATEDDPRITSVGKFIRRTRLDELPQLVNVLTGSMSLVGPRPEREVFVEELAEKIPYFRQRHIVKPGLTGWAQINYPYGNTVEDALQKLQFDLFYIKYQSFLFDLSILFNTIKMVILRKGT